MSDGVHLFLAMRTGTMRMSLRRYASPRPEICPKNAYGHSAKVVIEEAVPDDASMTDERGEPLTGRSDDAWPHTDPRWPTHCACGYAFADDDPWQLIRDELYQANIYGQQPFTFDDAPRGAMLRAPWCDRLGPGEAYWIVLPDGNTWVSNSKASSGQYWTVTGTPPAITVRPSIWANPPHGWHGFITAGLMTPA